MEHGQDASSASSAGNEPVAAKRERLRSLLQADQRRDESWTPLAMAQRRLWDLEHSQQSPGVHQFAIAYDIEGPIQIPLLHAAMRWVALRHAALRVQVTLRGGEPGFEVIPAFEPPLKERDCSRAAADADGIEALLTREAARPISLTEGPGWRAVIIGRGGEGHTLLLGFHHMIADRWSVAVFASDLATAYEALLQGTLSPSPPARML